MPITKENYGRHEDVHVIEFGTGDILMTKAREEGKIADNILCFTEKQGPSIGNETDEYNGESVDELPNISVILRFNRPESITALIHSLTELQKSVFENQKKGEQCA